MSREERKKDMKDMYMFGNNILITEPVNYREMSGLVHDPKIVEKRCEPGTYFFKYETDRPGKPVTITWEYFSRKDVAKKSQKSISSSTGKLGIWDKDDYPLVAKMTQIVNYKAHVSWLTDRSGDFKKRLQECETNDNVIHLMKEGVLINANTDGKSKIPVRFFRNDNGNVIKMEIATEAKKNGSRKNRQTENK